MANTARAIAVIFLIAILISFIVVFFLQYCRILPGTERLVVLSTRTALFLPLYAFFVFLTFVDPNVHALVEIPTSIVEAYSFYCFFSLLVTNLGGPQAAAETFQGSTKGLAIECCNSCCIGDRVVFYKRTVRALFHFVVTRNFIIVLAAIAYYTHTRLGKAAYAFLHLCAAIILIHCFLSVLIFCK